MVRVIPVFIVRICVALMKFVLKLMSWADGRPDGKVWVISGPYYIGNQINVASIIFVLKLLYEAAGSTRWPS